MSKNSIRSAAILVLLLGLLVASLAPLTAQSNLTGDLTVYLQAYYDPTNAPSTAALSEAMVKSYTDSHPGVNITLVPVLPPDQNYETWLAARMAADQTPDIAWQQYGPRNVRGSAWWVPLDDYITQPNPYIAEGTPGHDKWMDSLPDYIWGQTRAGDSHWYQVSLDWVETGLFYNKDLFAKAGIDPAKWTNWTSFINDMQTLKDKTGAEGLGAFVKQDGWSNWWWADDLFLTVAWADMSNDLYMDKYNDANRPWRQLNPEEIAKAIIDGKLNATDPRMDDYLRLSKDFVSVLPVDYTGFASLDDLDQVFFSGQLGAYWTGTWKNKLFSTSVPFDYGVTYIPAFTTDDAPHAQNTAYRVGGPTSAGQFGIPQSTAKAGKLDLALDFLMYMSAPQNFGPLAVDLGSYIPMMAGAQAGPVMAGFQDIAKLPERLFNDPDSRLTAETANQWNVAMEAFFLGQTDEAATKDALQKIWMDGAKALCVANSYDWCPAS